MSRFLLRKRRGGFTLIEIMIVVLIISVLLAIAIPNFMRARETSRAKSCCANLRQIETGKEQWAMDNKKSDGDVVAMADIVPDYVKDEPTCPSGHLRDVHHRRQPRRLQLPRSGAAVT
jgi:prepilin-type N-terminal cleavage/methylation domain-containing protein